MFRVFLIIFVFSLAEEGSGFDTKVTHFQYFRKHPNLKKCASTILKRGWYVRVRVSEKTGECDRFANSLSLKFERGYAYATKVFVKETFQPPVDEVSKEIPGKLDTGARLDMFILIKKPEELELRIDLFGKTTVEINRSFTFSRGQFSYYENINFEKVVEMHNYAESPAQFTSQGIVKVSLLVRSTSVECAFQLLVEDEVFFTAGVDHVYSLKQLLIYNWRQEGIMGIHRIEFTAVL